MADLSGLAARFMNFGAVETPSASPLYARLALAVAEDADLLQIAAACPPSQPPGNLFLGAVHFLLLSGATDDSGLARYYPSLCAPGASISPDSGLEPAFRAFCLAHADEIAPLLHTRLVQTNEVGRCASSLPAFGLLQASSPPSERQPLWLVEVGASAGLNLYWDRYGYSYRHDTGEIAAQAGDFRSPVQLSTTLRGAVPPLPAPMPAVSGRIGIDLHPIDVRDGDAVAWLRALIWPEHHDRVERLMAAARLVSAEPPQLLEGDALELLPGVLAGAPLDALLVVVHTFTLHQFTAEGRAAFREIVGQVSHRRPVVEVGIEMDRSASRARITMGEYERGAVEVRELGWCDGHGRWLAWNEQT